MDRHFSLSYFHIDSSIVSLWDRPGWWFLLPCPGLAVKTRDWLIKLFFKSRSDRPTGVAKSVAPRRNLLIAKKKKKIVALLGTHQQAT